MKELHKTSCSCTPGALKGKPAKDGKKISALNILSAVALFLFPKCPLCWATYASVFSFLGLEQIEYNSNWKYMILSLFLLGSVFLIRKHYLNRSWLSIILYSSGMVLLLTIYYLSFSQTWWLYIVAFLMIMSNFPLRNIPKLLNY